MVGSDVAARARCQASSWVLVRAEGLTDADIGGGDGRQIVFVAPEAVAGLDKSHSCEHFVTELLGSSTYRDLVTGLVCRRRSGS